MDPGTPGYSLQEAIWTLVLLNIASRRLYGPWYLLEAKYGPRGFYIGSWRPLEYYQEASRYRVREA